MVGIQLTTDRIEVRRRFGRKRNLFYEELRSVQRNGSSLALGLADGSTMSVRMKSRQMTEVFDELQAVIAGDAAALTRTLGLDDMSAELNLWTQRQGFSAAPFVRYILKASSQLGASDLHCEPIDGGYQLKLRLHGELVDIATLPAPVGRRVIGRMKVLAGVLVHRDDIVQEGRADVEGPGTDVRLSFVPSVRGESATARLFDRLKGEASLENLGFEPSIVDALRQITQRRGVLLFAGPSASGKTTSLYTVLRDLMARWEKKPRVVTIEDPVEYRLSNAVQLEVAPERNNTYATLLKSVLRQDANVIVVGEIRDPETAALTIRAGLTGHLVLTTIHAGRATEALLRLLEMGIEGSMLASAITGVLTQRLIRCRDEHGCVVRRTAVGEVLTMSDSLARMLGQTPSLTELDEVADTVGRIPESERPDHPINSVNLARGSICA